MQKYPFSNPKCRNLSTRSFKQSGLGLFSDFISVELVCGYISVYLRLHFLIYGIYIYIICLFTPFGLGQQPSVTIGGRREEIEGKYICIFVITIRWNIYLHIKWFKQIENRFKCDDTILLTKKKRKTIMKHINFLDKSH